MSWHKRQCAKMEYIEYKKKLELERQSCMQVIPKIQSLVLHAVLSSTRYNSEHRTVFFPVPIKENDVLDYFVLLPNLFVVSDVMGQQGMPVGVQNAL